jgi:uncharacterized membrane protein YbaN (DUF454 family)
MSLHALERQWLRLWKGPPGRRFQNLYRRSHRPGEHDHLSTHLVRFGLAAVFLAVGIVLIFLPLVYIPFLLGSAAMLASESSLIARGLDHSEAWSRRFGRRWKEKLGLSTRTVNVISAVIAIGFVATAGYAFYRRFQH